MHNAFCELRLFTLLTLILLSFLHALLLQSSRRWTCLSVSDFWRRRSSLCHSCLFRAARSKGCLRKLNIKWFKDLGHRLSFAAGKITKSTTTTTLLLLPPCSHLCRIQVPWKRVFSKTNGHQDFQECRTMSETSYERLSLDP